MSTNVGSTPITSPIQQMINFELAMGHIREAVAFVNTEGDILWCNDPFSDLLSHTELPQKIWDAVPLQAQTDNAMPWEKIAHETRVTQEYRTTDDPPRTLMIYVSRVNQSRAFNTLYVISDVTEDNLQQAQALQSQKLESIGTLAAGIAHEMNTPIQYINDNMLFLKESINDIIQFIELSHSLLQGEGDPGDIRNKLLALYKNIDLEYLRDEVPTCIYQTQKGTEHITKLVRSMKQFSHPGDQKLTVTDLAKICDTVRQVSEGTWKRNCRIEINIAEDAQHVISNEFELHQILLNLIINSTDAIVAKFGSDTQEGLIKIHSQAAENEVALEVSDNGCGIPESIINKIYDPFFTTKPVGQGTGQGLAIIHQSIKNKLQGDIKVESVVNEGTTFRITLPAGDSA